MIGTNPLDWTAEPFLSLYIGVATIVLLVLWWWRHRVGPGQPGIDAAGLSVFAMAYLAGGPMRAADTILVALFEAGVVELGRKPNKISIDTSSVVPARLRAYVSELPQEMTRRRFQSLVRERTEPIREELAARGLIAAQGAASRFEMASLLLIAVPLALGVSKMVVGHARGRPIGILTVLVLATAAVGLMMIFTKPHRTRAGSAELRRIRAEKARLARAPRDAEVLMAFALAGSSVLAGRSYQALFRPPGGGGDGGDGGGGGGGGCGGCSA